MAEKKLLVNRAPVLTLWASVVAERLGYDRQEALTLGQAVAGMNAYSKGRRLGIYSPPEEGEQRERRKTEEPQEIVRVSLLGRDVPARPTAGGLRAEADGRPANPDRVEAYLSSKFGERLEEVRQAMESLARSLDPQALEEKAYALYEEFRPGIPAGKKGWGAAGELDLAFIRSLAAGR
jgi:hypothetical protein